MQVALISPISLQENRVVPNTKYHLVLAHLLRDPNYKALYSRIEGYKILDNGAAEGSMVDPIELIGSAAAIGADEVVIPDAVGDCDRTIEMAWAFKGIAEQHPEFKYMGVVQGRTMAEHQKCLTALSFLEYISVLALPRHMCKIHRLQRYYFAESIPEMDLGARFDAIHCLGASSWTREIVALSELPLLRGIDTSMPIVLGLAWIDLAESSDYTPRPIGYFKLDTVHESQEAYVGRNIRTYLQWAATPSFGELREVPPQ